MVVGRVVLLEVLFLFRDLWPLLPEGKPHSRLSRGGAREAPLPGRLVGDYLRRCGVFNLSRAEWREEGCAVKLKWRSQGTGNEGKREVTAFQHFSHVTYYSVEPDFPAH